MLTRSMWLAVVFAVLSAIALNAQNQATVDVQTQPADANAPITITLEDALKAARQYASQYLSAVTDAGVAHEDTVQARAAMLPTVSALTSFVYTEGNGSAASTFIANNGVHEYIAQGNGHEVVNLFGGLVHDYRRARFVEAAARAKAEIAARGLLVTVVQNYYGLVASQRKYATAQQAADEAQHFLTISQQLEHGGEVAHSDVIKAQIQNNDRQRDLREAQIGMEKARLNLAVIIFPKLNQNFAVVDDMRLPPPLPPAPEVQELAQRNNPDIKAALEAYKAAGSEVMVARSGHFPTLTMDVFYGIDANHFATYTDGVRNLGYSASATLNIPIWTWGATQSKVKQAVLRQRQAKVELSTAQKTLLANLQSFYSEAAAARDESEALRQSADLAAESLRLTTLRYQAGEATVLEVVDAQNTLAQARNAFDDGETRYRVALAQLQTLTGRF